MTELGEQFSQRFVRAGGDCVEGGKGVDHSRVVVGEYVDAGGGEFVGVGQALVSEWVVVRNAEDGGGESLRSVARMGATSAEPTSPGLLPR